MQSSYVSLPSCWDDRGGHHARSCSRGHFYNTGPGGQAGVSIARAGRCSRSPQGFARCIPSQGPAPSCQPPSPVTGSHCFVTVPLPSLVWTPPAGLGCVLPELLRAFSGHGFPYPFLRFSLSLRGVNHSAGDRNGHSVRTTCWPSWPSLTLVLAAFRVSSPHCKESSCALWGVQLHPGVCLGTAAPLPQL